MDAREDRYARHRQIAGWDQARLAEGRILVAGAGAIGNEVIKLLALVGVGQIVIVDFDTIERSNLTRSVLFREGDIGRRKAEVAAERARDLNPDIRVEPLCADLEFEVGLGIYRAMDVVIGGLDSINARLALNRLCYRAGVPWLNGGIETTVAEVALYQAGRGACYECALSPSMWETRNRRFSCGGLRSDAPDEAVPTTAVVASITAGYLVNEALALLHAQDPKSGLEFSEKLYLTLSPYRHMIQKLPQNPDCLAHDLWSPVEALEHSPHSLTARELLALAGEPDGVLELGFDLLTQMRCLRCEQTETILRPLERCSAGLRACPQCGTDSRHPQTISWLDADSEWVDCALSALSLPEYAVVPIKGAQRRRYIQLTGIYSFLNGTS
jgi:adenylyltransferase/sulfurtransferase